MQEVGGVLEKSGTRGEGVTVKDIKSINMISIYGTKPNGGVAINSTFVPNLISCLIDSSNSKEGRGIMKLP